jgi:hypothetical protein
LISSGSGAEFTAFMVDRFVQDVMLKFNVSEKQTYTSGLLFDNVYEIKFSTAARTLVAE